MDFISETSTEYLLSLRIVRIEIAPGIYENLITNLPDIEFDMDDLKELYHLRWSQETAYRDLKYPLCLKAFHSKNIHISFKKYLPERSCIITVLPFPSILNYGIVPENCNIRLISQKLSKYAEMIYEAGLKIMQ